MPNGRPDVYIYSQREVWSTGGTPTWDSPDLWSWRGRNKQIGPLEEIIVRVHNRSTLAPAKGAIVRCQLAPLGIGTPRTELFSRVVDVPAASVVELRQATPAPFSSADRPPGVYATAHIPGDLYGGDNDGSQVTHGMHTSVVGREPYLEFPVANATGGDLSLTLHTQPNGLAAIVTPTALNLAPTEQAIVRMSCTVSSSLHPASPLRLEATVFARTTEGELYGGLTLFVIVDD